MKKILALSLVASSVFSMELAYRLQTPFNHSNRIKARLVKADKLQVQYTVSKSEPMISNKIDAKKVRIDQSSVHVPHRLGDIELYHGKKGFVVLQEDKKHVIEKCFMDPIARTITKEQLSSFLKMGYFALNQTNDGCFTLKAHQRLVGGGLLFGKIMYWATKTVCYAVLIAGAGAIVICGGTIGAGASKGSTPSNASVGEVVDTMIQGTEQAILGKIAVEATITQVGGEAIFSPAVVGGAMTGVGIVAGGIIKAGGAPLCAKATGAALATGTSGGGIVAGIEAISLTVGVLCGLTPTP